MKELDLTDRTVFATWTEDIVRYRDLDPNGHVNNGAINQYFEDGRVHLREERMTDLGGNVLTGFAIKKFTATYHDALSYPATIDIGSVVSRIGNSSFVLGQGVFDGERCIATADVISVFFDTGTGMSIPLPDAVRLALDSALAEQSD
jgi:acyl-CoA thioester hydrolase